MTGELRKGNACRKNVSGSINKIIVLGVEFPKLRICGPFSIMMAVPAPVAQILRRREVYGWTYCLEEQSMRGR
jgi:hypothetical protein